MAINPKLLKKYQTGGYVNPYDIPGTGTGEGQLFGGQGVLNLTKVVVVEFQVQELEFTRLVMVEPQGLVLVTMIL